MEKNSHSSIEICTITPSEGSTANEIESPISLPAPCIYRVPKRLRHVKKKAYTPNVVSIGPLHHGGEELLAMEAYKKKYMDDLICKTHKSMECYYEVVWQKEEQLRACYEEEIGFSSDEFVKMILMDAAFIIGFLLRFRFREVRDGKDQIFGKPWMKQDIWLDMLLLENQLPFFILGDLFPQQLTYTSDSGNEVSINIFELSWFFFKELLHLEVMEGRLDQIRSSDIRHFVDFLRFLYLPPNEQNGGKLQTITIPSITALLHAGIKFKARSNKNLLDLQFEHGILQIPKLIVGDETEISMCNLIAFEQCYYEDRCINDYIVLMNRLVNTKEDVDLVVKYGILENRLSNNKKGSSLINELEDGVVLDFENFYFATLSEELNKYCSSHWRKWRADLMQNYFSTPWTTISVVAAVILLLLTLLQTIYSVKS